MAAKAENTYIPAHHPRDVDMKLVHEQKAKMREEFEKYKDHVFLPKHPNMTGAKDECWACGQKMDPEKAIFKETVNWRNPIREQTKDPNKTCMFCQNDCFMHGWPLVRHHFVIVGTQEDGTPYPEAAAAAPETAAAEPAKA